MKKKHWTDDETSIDDLPNEGLRLVAEVLGLDVTIKLMRELGGIRINIPKGGAKKTIENYIVRKYKARNVKRLAIETGTTERYVEGVLSRAGLL